MSAIYSDYTTVNINLSGGKAGGPNYAPVLTLLQQGYIPIGGPDCEGLGCRQALAKPTGTARGGAVVRLVVSLVRELVAEDKSPD